MSITNTSSTQAQSQSVSDMATEVEVNDETSSAQVQGEETDTTDTELKDSETEGEESDESEAQDKPKRKSGNQRLKERHARELAAVHRRIEELEARTQRGQSQDSTTQGESKDAKPQAEKFNSHEDYLEALTDWKLEQRDKAAEQKSKDAQAKQTQAEQLKAYNDRLESFKKSNPTFEDAIEDFTEEHGDVKLSVGVHDSIIDSDLGPQILLELVSDPKELTRINSLSASAAAREIGKIEERLSQRSVKKETQTTTKASAPLSPVNKGAATATRKSIFDEGISFKDYERMRRDSARKKA